MKRLAIVLLMSSLTVWGPAAARAEALPDEPHVVVEGNASVRVAPDELDMTLRIIEVDRDVSKATSAVEERSARFLELLKKMGVDRSDIGSSELYITPRYNWKNQEQVRVATEVSRRVHLTLRDLTRYADLVDALMEAGVGQVESTVLGTTKEEELRRKALQRAMRDARQQAELLVAAFGEDGGKGARLGSVYAATALSRGGVRDGVVQAFEQRGGRASFEPGTIELSESVRVVYFIAR